jgi:hypothetical protein
VDVPVIAIDDLLVENTESFTFRVTTTGLTWTNNQSEISASITDNDLQVNTINVTTQNANENGTDGWIKLTRSNASSEAYINYTILPGASAIESTDFQQLYRTTPPGSSTSTRTIRFPAGQSSVTIPVIAIDDLNRQELRSFTFQIDNGSGALNVIPPNSLVSIVDNEPAPDVFQVLDLGLINDDGLNDTDRITSEPRVKGRLSGDTPIRDESNSIMTMMVS